MIRTDKTPAKYATTNESTLRDRINLTKYTSKSQAKYSTTKESILEKESILAKETEDSTERYQRLSKARTRRYKSAAATDYK